MSSGRVVIAFGRMNPPTTGHAKLIDFVLTTAQQLDARAVFFATPTQDPKKNPLPFNVKVNFLKQLFPKVTFNSNRKIRTPFDALKALQLLGYTDVTVVVGSDRVGDFESFRRYVKSSKKKAKKTDIILNDYRVIAVPGERDPDSDDISGMSASKLRAYAAEGDFEGFRSGVPTKNERLARQIYTQVRAFMGVKK